MRRNFARLAVLVCSTTLVTACQDWFTTFGRQPAIHPWQVATMDSARRDSTPARGNPQGSVPLYGSDIPSWVVSYQPFMLMIDSLKDLPNPKSANDESINRGHRYYQTTCVVCHGDSGAGDGLMTMAKGGQFPPIPIISETAKALTDGQIFGIIRNGRASMPSYNRIEAEDRWDVVNYVRGLQGKLGRAVPTGPLGTPGETGAKIPGITTVAPQRPIPHFPPARIGGGE